MSSKLLIAAFLLALTAVAADRSEQPLPIGFSNLANAKVIEIKDSTGQAVLRGSFTTEDADKDESELKASLTGTGIGSKAKGKAEIEIEKKNGTVTKQELELKVDDLPASTTFKVFIDGNEFATITTDKEGEADLKFSSKNR